MNVADRAAASCSPRSAQKEGAHICAAFWLRQKVLDRSKPPIFPEAHGDVSSSRGALHGVCRMQLEVQHPEPFPPWHQTRGRGHLAAQLWGGWGVRGSAPCTLSWPCFRVGVLPLSLLLPLLGAGRGKGARIGSSQDHSLLVPQWSAAVTLRKNNMTLWQDP